MNKIEEIKFVADVMLGKLSQYLLISGFDCEYRKKFPDKQLVQFARSEQRIVLTRDIQLVETLIKNDKVSLLKETELKEQLHRLKEEYNLRFLAKNLFSRCLDCNRKLRTVPKQSVQTEVPEESFRWLDTFYRCPECGSVFWKGTHYQAIKKRLKEWNLLDEE